MSTHDYDDSFEKMRAILQRTSKKESSKEKIDSSHSEKQCKRERAAQQCQ
jgi:hypothetical protein